MAWFSSKNEKKEVYRGDTKTIGKVTWTVERVIDMAGQMEAVAFVTINDKEYHMLHTMNTIIWNDNGYLHDLTKTFLFKVMMQEYELDYHAELTVKQAEFLSQLKNFTMDAGMVEESTMVENVIKNNGYGNDERRILNILRDKYIDENI